MVHLFSTFDDLYDCVYFHTCMPLSNCNVTNSNDQILTHVSTATFSRAGCRF